MKKKIKFNTGNVVVSIIVTLVLGLIVWTIWLVCKPIEYMSTTYQLNELNDGTYAIYYTTHSKAPAHNYEVVTLNCNGNIYTFKGHVWISYLKDNISPYVVYEDCNVVYADKISVYVPEGTVEYQGSLRVD